MKAILVTCPHCGARVQVVGASDEVRCEYCGTASRVQRRTRVFERVMPPPPMTAHRPATIAIQQRNPILPLIVLSFVIIPLAIAGAIAFVIWRAVDRAVSTATTYTTTSEPASSPSSTRDPAAPEWQGTDAILFADVDGNGTRDVVGRSRRVRDNDQVRVIAIDGATGAARWESDTLGTYSDTYQGKLVVAGDLVVFASPRAEVQAFALATGKKRWAIKLDERIKYLCDGGRDVVNAVGADDVMRMLSRSDGSTIMAMPIGANKPRNRRAPPTQGPCTPLPTDDDARSQDRDPASWKLAQKHGISLDQALAIPSGKLLSGTRAKGTNVPTLVALDTAGNERWRVDVPTDPLGSLERAPEYVAAGEREVCTGYYTDSVAKPHRVACFALADGRRRWDMEAGDNPLRLLQVADRTLYIGTVGSLVAIDLESGKPRWTFGH